MQGSHAGESTEALAVYQFLKETKNELVGHQNAKAVFCRIPSVISYINHNATTLNCSDRLLAAIHTEAARVVAALACGPKQILLELLSSSALETLLSALSRPSPTESTSLRLALTRALRSLASAAAEVVGPPLWGLEDDTCDIRHAARSGLDQLFQETALDIVLPLLSEPDTQLNTSICQLLASSIRMARYRIAVTDWLPPDDRLKQNKGKRGWEDPMFTSTNSPSRQGGWVIRHLAGMIRCNEPKLQESALMAMAALVKDSAHVASILTRSSPDAPSVLSSVLTLLKARDVGTRLAACQCMTNIIRKEQAGRGVNHPLESSKILHVLNGTISNQSELPSNRIRACFVLSSLVADDEKCCQSALTSGTVLRISELIKSMTPIERPQEWDDGEPRYVLRLRESALSAVAALTLHHKEIRGEVANNFGLMPYISLCMSHPHVGVRHASLQCVRSLSRAVSVLRTSILDSGVSETLCKIIEDHHEDRRVTSAALAGVCNLLNDFSPLRKTIIEKGTLRRIAALSVCPDHSIRLNAAWAVRNSLYKAPIEESKSIMSQVGWDILQVWTHDTHEDVKEQAFAAMCNFASTDRGVKEIIDAFHVLGEDLLDILSNSAASANEDIICQVMYVFGNIANGSHQHLLVSHRGILTILHNGIRHPRQEICRAALKCIESLARYPELREERIDVTLRIIAKDGGSSSGGHVRVPELDAEIKRIAKHALHTLDSPIDDY